MVIVANAFSLSMVPNGADISCYLIDIEEVNYELRHRIYDDGEEFKSIVGHADTAAVYSNLLDMDIPYNRETFVVPSNESTVMFVGQLIGGRLPEGATTLPEGYKIQWMEVIIDPYYPTSVDI